MVPSIRIAKLALKCIVQLVSCYSDGHITQWMWLSGRTVIRNDDSNNNKDVKRDNGLNGSEGSERKSTKYGKIFNYPDKREDFRRLTEHIDNLSELIHRLYESFQLSHVLLPSSFMQSGLEGIDFLRELMFR